MACMADLAPSAARPCSAVVHGAREVWRQRGGDVLPARQGEELGRSGSVELAQEDAAAAGGATGLVQARGLADRLRARIWRGLLGPWRRRAWATSMVVAFGGLTDVNAG
ncbi:hypothetical protein D1007_05802 [Hordeum vulgare]|nr:hypothetical protein D1007_05802 [Hordeum vulgare]